MADELKLSLDILFKKGDDEIDAGDRFTLDVSGNNGIDNRQTIGTSWEALQLGDVSSIAYIAIKNLDASNYIEIAVASDGTNKFAKILPGTWALIPAIAAATYYALANSSAVVARVIAIPT